VIRNFTLQKDYSRNEIKLLVLWPELLKVPKVISPLLGCTAEKGPVINNPQVRIYLHVQNISAYYKSRNFIFGRKPRRSINQFNSQLLNVLLTSTLMLYSRRYHHVFCVRQYFQALPTVTYLSLLKIVKY